MNTKQEGNVMGLMGRAQAAAQAVLDETEAEGIPLTRGGAYRLTYVALACDDANHPEAVEALRLIARRGDGTWSADRCLVEATEALRKMGDPTTTGGQ